MEISAVIITFNEEKNLDACLSSLDGVADELIVLDSFSTDGTESICRKRGIRFEQHVFDGHVQQKNRARKMASHEWVLSLDADEQLDSALRENLIALKKTEIPAEVGGFRMNRLNYYCGKPIKTCGWYPDTKLRLWRRESGEWQGPNPHDRFELIKGSVTKHISGNILHNTYPTHEDMVNQVEKFAAISAKHFQSKPLLVLLLKLLFSPTFKFLKNYFLKLGFTDGSAGLLICLYQMKGVASKYFQAIRLKWQ